MTRAVAAVRQLLALPTRPDLRHRAAAKLSAAVTRTRWAAGRKRVGRPIIAIGLTDHMGDIVAAEPIARHLRSEHPDALIVWAVRPPFDALLVHNPHVDAVLRLRCLTEWMHLVRRHPFDRVVDLHVPGRDCTVCRVPYRKESGDPAISLRNYYAFGNLLAAFCRTAGLPPLAGAPRVYIPDAARRAVDRLRLPQRFVAVHCTSNQSSRDWTADRWNALARELSPDAIAVVEVGLRPVLDPATGVRTDPCGRIGILETAELIRRAALFIGIDSGPAHLANAVGTPGVILLGHYAAYTRYMPYSGAYGSGENADVIQWHGPARDIPVESVRERAVQRLREHAAR